MSGEQEVGTLFYIVNLEQSKRAGDVVFWKWGGAGYTRDLGRAGLFDQKYCDQRKHNKELVFVPEESLNDADTIQVVPLSVFKELRGE